MILTIEEQSRKRLDQAILKAPAIMDECLFAAVARIYRTLVGRTNGMLSHGVARKS